MPEQNPVLTPSQLNTLARDLLESAFPLVWVEGELGNITRPGSGHLYFTLKDARAQVRCAMFRPKSQWLKFVPREGLKVLGRGRLTLYEARGDYQLVFDPLEEAGEGALRRAFEALKVRLEAEGLFDAARKRELPAYVRRLAVITSPTGAAVRDVLSVLSRRLPLLEVDVLPSLRSRAKPRRRRSPTCCNARAPAVATTRCCWRAAAARWKTCGRSTTNAWSARSRLRRYPSYRPSATKPTSPGRLRRRRARADTLGGRRAAGTRPARSAGAPAHARLARPGVQRQHLRQAMQRADRAVLRLQAQSPQSRLRLLRQRQGELMRRLQALWRERLQQRNARLRHADAVLRAHHPARRLAQLQARLQRLQARPRAAISRTLQRDALQLRALARSLEACSPLATVARGYSILTRSDDGRLVHSVTQVAPGDRLQARVRDGVLSLSVDAVRPDEPADAPDPMP